jgi:hypothetical protein
MALTLPRALGERYSPHYFLAALGAGGMTANFFVWLLFWVPHPERAVPVFEDIDAAFASGSRALQGAIGVAMGGIALFALLHIRLLLWNIIEYHRFQRTEAAAALRSGNAETQLLALPLTAAMAVNVGFILGMVFVPGLWTIIEYLFPLALAAFLLISIWALRLIGDFYGRILTEGSFDCARNNSFAQMLPAFALAMIGVGLAAPSSMSTVAATAGVSWLLSTFFVTAALLLGAVTLVLGMRAMMEGGANAESAPTLWIGVPILTVLAITLMRQGHGANMPLGAQGTPADDLQMLAAFLSAQLAFLALGAVVMKRHRYASRYLAGDTVSPGAWALVCPGVALGVMGHFFINKGLVAAGLIAQFGLPWLLLTGLALALQGATIVLILRIARHHFRQRAPAPHLAVPAE